MTIDDTRKGLDHDAEICARVRCGINCDGSVTVLQSDHSCYVERRLLYAWINTCVWQSCLNLKSILRTVTRNTSKFRLLLQQLGPVLRTSTLLWQLSALGQEYNPRTASLCSWRWRATRVEVSQCPVLRYYTMWSVSVLRDRLSFVKQVWKCLTTSCTKTFSIWLLIKSHLTSYLTWSLDSCRSVIVRCAFLYRAHLAGISLSII